MKNPERIQDLRAYFCRALINEIHRARNQAYSSEIPAGYTDVLDEVRQTHPSPSSIENEISMRLLIEGLLTRFERDLRQLMESIPGRSKDPHLYKLAIAETARKVLLSLREEDLSSADLNMILRTEYPQWWDEPGLTRATYDQRFSRGRSDVRHLLQLVARGDLPSEFSLRYGRLGRVAQ